MMVLLLPAALASSPLAVWDFASDDGAFISGGQTAQWEWGAPPAGALPEEPDGNVWATVIDGSYLNDTRDTLTLPTWDLSAVAQPSLSFRQWYELDAGGIGDRAYVEVFQGGEWNIIDPIYDYPTTTGFTGSSNGWQTAYFDLVGVQDLAHVRLVLETDLTIALAGWYVDDFILQHGDCVPPQIELVSGPAPEVEFTGELPVLADVRDDIGVATVEAITVDGSGSALRTPMTQRGDGLWTGDLGLLEPNQVIEWWMEASDGLNTTASDPQTSRIYLPAPSDLTLPEERIVGQSVPASWTPPLSTWPVLDYTVYADGELALQTQSSEADIPVSGRDPIITVRATFDTDLGPLIGDPSASAQASLAYPIVSSISPSSAYGGDVVRLTITGTDLLLVQDQAAISFGEGIEVLDLAVHDVNTAIATVSIQRDAAVGPRALTLVTNRTTLTTDAVLSVYPDADRPRIVRVSPSAMEAGTQLDVELRLSSPVDGSDDQLRLDVGDGIAADVTSASGQTIRATLVAGADAAIGLRPVVVDDGTRLLGGGTLRVRKQQPIPSSSCAATNAPRRAIWLLALIGLLGGVRRVQKP